MKKRLIKEFLEFLLNEKIKVKGDASEEYKILVSNSFILEQLIRNVQPIVQCLRLALGIRKQDTAFRLDFMSNEDVKNGRKEYNDEYISREDLDKL